MPREETEKNLIPVKTEEEARKLGQKGGLKSGKVRKQKKTLRELASQIINLPLNKLDESICEKVGIDLEFVPTKGAMAFLSCFYQSVQRGDTNALEKLYNMAGETFGPIPGGSSGSSDGRPIIIMRPKEFPENVEEAMVIK